MLDSLVIPLIVTVLGGFLLLLFEYKTSWFQNNVLKSGQEDKAIATVTPLNKLDSPAADWLQIAKEVQKWLEELYCKNSTPGKYPPTVQLEGIYQPQLNWVGFDVKKSDREIRYYINDKLGNRFTGTVLVQPNGKIIGFFKDRVPT